MAEHQEDQNDALAAFEAYDWDQHVWTADRGGANPALVPMWREHAAKLARNPTGYEVTTDGGCPRVGWREVLRAEMRTGWPYHRPVPSVLTMGPLGSEWVDVMSITEICEKRPRS